MRTIKTIRLFAAGLTCLSMMATASARALGESYIQSTGVEFIDTGVVPDNTTRMIIDYQLLSVGNGYHLMGFGGDEVQFDFGATDTANEDSGVFFFFGKNWASCEATAYNVCTRHTLELCGEGWAKIDGGAMISLTALDGSARKNVGGIYLFASNERSYGHGSPTKYFCQARIFSCQIYQGEKLVRDFVPSLLSSGDFGFVDVLTGMEYGDLSGNRTLQGHLEEAQWRDFNYQSKIEFTACGVTNKIENFPVPLRLSPTTVSGFDYAQVRGPADLAVFDCASGAELNYEVENWNPDGESLIWVSISNFSQKTKLKLYWGRKSTSSSWQPPFKVWQPANYAAVLHFANTTGRDSANQVDLISKGTVEVAASGAIGPCCEAQSNNSRMELANFPMGDCRWATALLGSEFTISFWVKVDEGGKWPKFMNWGSFLGNNPHDGIWIGGCLDTSAPADVGHIMWNGAQVGPEHDGMKGRVTSTAASYDKEWAYLTLTCSSANGKVTRCGYFNGVYDEGNVDVADLPSGIENYVTSPNGQLYLMNAETVEYNNKSSSISMDEFRISSCVRSKEYIAAEYRSMANPDFATLGAKEPASAPVARGLLIVVR